MLDLAKIYKDRFEDTGLAKRNKVWRVLCRSYFQKLVARDATVLDLACGYGEFINNIEAKRKIAIDLNPDAPKHLNAGIEFYRQPGTDLSPIADGTVDVAFTSNFLEHLRDKAELDAVFREVRRCLAPDGRFIILGPNIRYAYAEYWDFYDHYLPLSHLSLAEGLTISDFAIESVVDRFLPYTMNNKTPTNDLLVQLYLAMPFAWRFVGKQFLVVARRKRHRDQLASTSARMTGLRAVCGG